MPVTVDDVLLGPVELFVAPFATAEPANAEVTPGVLWIPAGGTEEGVRQIVNQSYTAKRVDEVAMRVGSKLNELDVALATSLAEARLDNFRMAYNLALSAGTTLGLNGNVTNGEPPYVAILARGFGPDNQRRNVIVRKGLSTESVESRYSRASQTYIPITWTGHYISESVDAFFIDDTQAA
jgi:hypothetical protein